MDTTFLQGRVNRLMLFFTVFLALVYFYVVVFAVEKGNYFSALLLVVSEVFHLFQTIGYITTVRKTDYEAVFDGALTPSVDVFITVCGEPEDIVSKTIRAAKAMRYNGEKRIYVLNDGLVAKKDNWQEIEALCALESIGCITRQVGGGAKAGNINNALRQTAGELILVFDADHASEPDFLEKTIGYFADPLMGFVQTPQYYKNQHDSYVAGAAWEQQMLFFGPIMKGKNRSNSVFMCGTNMIGRRDALLQVGGMCETNIAEDFLTSLFVHQKGWKSVYVPEVLAQGLAPEDFLSYYKQQHRWARGSLEVVFRENPLLKSGLSWRHKFQYLLSASYYLSGFVVLINLLLPLLFFYFDIVPVTSASMIIAMFFIPFLVLNLLTLQATSNYSYTYRALAFSLSSFWIFLQALFDVLSGRKSSFAVTSKTQISGNFVHLALPHIIYIVLALVGIVFASTRYELTSSSLITNASWALLNCGIFLPFIYASSPFSNRGNQQKVGEDLSIKLPVHPLHKEVEV
jgi:cellulose synthase (UDP-forming)